MKQVCKKCMSQYEGLTCPLCASIEKETKKAEENGEVVTVSDDLPKSFLLTSEYGMERVYLCQFNAQTLEKRMK